MIPVKISVVVFVKEQGRENEETFRSHHRFLFESEPKEFPVSFDGYKGKVLIEDDKGNLIVPPGPTPDIRRVVRSGAIAGETLFLWELGVDLSDSRQVIWLERLRSSSNWKEVGEVSTTFAEGCGDDSDYYVCVKSDTPVA